MKLPRFAIFQSLVIIFLISLVANGIWLFEISLIGNWHSKVWPHTELYSPYFLALFPAISYLLSWYFLQIKTMSKSRTIIPTLILYAINLLLYFIGKQICYTLFGRFGILWFVPVGLLVVLLPFAALGFSYWYVSKNMLNPLPGKLAVKIFLITLLVIPLSIVTALLLPTLGDGYLIDIVQMGYPVFWITALIGVCGIIAFRKGINQALSPNS